MEVLEKKEAEQNEKEEAEAIDEDFDPPENEKERAGEKKSPENRVSKGNKRRYIVQTRYMINYKGQSLTCPSTKLSGMARDFMPRVLHAIGGRSSSSSACDHGRTKPV